MHHIVYKTTHIDTERFYIGVHSTIDLTDGYLGSGRMLKLAIKQHGRSAFQREVLYFCDTKREAFKKEREIVNRAFVLDENTFNLCEGGSGHSGSDKRSRTIMVYNNNFELIDKFPTFARAGEFMDAYATTVRRSCQYADAGKSSRVKTFYVCFEGSSPVKKDMSYLTKRNKILAKYNTGRKRPAQSVVMRATNLSRPEANRIYKFVHISGIAFEGTRTQLRDAFPEQRLRASELANLHNGRAQSHRGWRLG